MPLEKPVEFQSEGATLRGFLITPDDHIGRLPLVVMAHGTSATIQMVPRWPGQIPPPLATPNSPRQDGHIMTTRVRRRCVRPPP